VFFRLWFLQVLSGDQYVSEARSNRVRKVKIEAPRGNIVDRNGQVLVTTRIAPVVQIIPTQLPDSELKVADQYRAALSAAERTRLAGEAKAERVRPAAQAEGPPADAARAARAGASWLRAARQAAPVAVPPIPRASSRCACTAGSGACCSCRRGRSTGASSRASRRPRTAT
jgi:penicillin-binding protein 2